MVKCGLLTTEDARRMAREFLAARSQRAYFQTDGRELSYDSSVDDRFVLVVNNSANDFEPFQCGKIKMPQVSFDSFATNDSFAAGYKTYELYDGDDTVGKTCVVQTFLLFSLPVHRPTIT